MCSQGEEIRSEKCENGKGSERVTSDEVAGDSLTEKRTFENA
jgi:hypothetical protein